MIKNKIFNLYKSKKCIFAFIFLIVIITLYIVSQNVFTIYKKPVIKILKADTSSVFNRTGTNGLTEKYYTQVLAGKIMNGKYKNKVVSFSNQYSNSQFSTEKYHKGDIVFAEISESENKINTVIMGQKRDSLLILLLGIFAIAVILAAGKSGIYTLISVLFNTIAFYLCINKTSTGTFLNFIWIPLIAFFTIVTLLLVGGFNKKTLGAILSCIICVMSVSLIYYFVIYKSNDLHYESIEYTIAFLSLKKIYLISIIIGILGAVMDVSITINSSVCEIVKSSKSISVKALIKSIKQISYDIMGTMMNVLFFSYISQYLPMAVLKLQNGYTVSLVFKYEYIFDIVRFLIGSIGIVLAIPISGFVSILIFRKKLKSR